MMMDGHKATFGECENVLELDRGSMHTYCWHLYIDIVLSIFILLIYLFIHLFIYYL